MAHIILGSIGMGYFIYGRKEGRFVAMACGGGLMLMPYLAPNTLVLLLASAILLWAPFRWRL